MKKKTLLCTTIAGTMLVAGLAMPGVKAATVENATAIVNETNQIVAVELANGKTQLTKTEVEALVEGRYADYGITVTAEVEGTLVGTGSTVTLSNGKTLKVVLYGDVDGNGTVASHDLQVIADHTVESPVITDEGKLAAGDVTSSDILNSSDIQRIANYIVLAETDLVESGKLPEEVIKATTPEEVAGAFEAWLANESGLEEYVYGTHRKYASLEDVAAIVNTARTDLEEAATVEEAEAVVKEAKEDVLAEVQEYVLGELKTAYEAANKGEFVLEEGDYNTVVEAIETATNVSDVITLYNGAMSGRITAKEYNFLAAKTAAKKAMDTEVETKNKELNTDNRELDEVLTAELERLVEEAKADIDAVEVKYDDYDTAKGNVEKIGEDAIKDIDAIYALYDYKNQPQNTPAVDAEYKTQLEALEDLEEKYELDLTAEKAELKAIYDAAKEAMTNAVTTKAYNEAWYTVMGTDDTRYPNDATNCMSKYVGLVTKKENAKNELKTKDWEKSTQQIGYDAAVAFVKAQATDPETEYTEVEAQKLLDVYNAGLEAIDAATVELSKDGENSVQVAVINAEKEMTKVAYLCGEVCKSRSEINAYVDTIKDRKLPGTETTYISELQSAIDAELAKLNEYAYAEGRTVAEVTAYVTTAKANIYKATTAYMSSLLDQYAAGTIKTTGTVLSLASYNAVEANKQTLEGFSKAPNPNTIANVITEFENMVILKTQSDLAKEMLDKFNEDLEINYLKTDKVTTNEHITNKKPTGNWKDLPQVKTAVENANFKTVRLASEYESKVEEYKTIIVKALKEDLGTVLEANKADKNDITFTRASTITAVLDAYKAIIAKLS